ncbi:DUF4160 domain-containing protein [Senegalimassilia faecalis]|uniref:DUF4160 domain-containing protein n=1 Tax=Senegalimassilia faecalis TaxID=2509433 RepID=A0A4Q2K0L0_9ACTN|nr:DUF4160 domain-containing protein [Senegalimassilia faecalis]RXZ54786.1 DUF4160 domain-containing protein [Senegalimassilia faecalis]
MPVIARFYGIVIRMYFLQSEHNPPHIHAIYGDDTAAFEIDTGELLDGPKRAKTMVEEWVELNKGELLTMWETQVFKKLSPLE